MDIRRTEPSVLQGLSKVKILHAEKYPLVLSWSPQWKRQTVLQKDQL